MKAVIKELKERIKGDVRGDPLIRQIYSVDASIYEVEPLAIVIPCDREDLQLALQIAASHHIPVTARGAATGITGSCLGTGLIIDTSKYLDRILEIDLAEESATCEPGVVQDRLNEALSPFGYRLGPDTSTGNRATLGGMTANNSAGARSLHYGKMSDHVLAVNLALAGGELLRCRPIDGQEWEKKRLQQDQEGQIYREVHRLLTTHRAAIKARFPKIPRNVSGYNLDLLLQSPPLNLSQLVVGSEGTLGIATEIKVKIAKKPHHTGLCIIHIHDVIAALQFLDKMLAHHPFALEMIDDNILAAGRRSPSMHNKLHWLSGHPKAVFVAEFEGATEKEVGEKLKAFAADMQMQHFGCDPVLITNPQRMDHVWEVRKAGLGLLLSKRSYSRAIAFIEDLSIHPQQLASFMKQFYSYLASVGKEAGIYGHIGSGCMHIRPYIDLRSREELALMKQIMKDVSSMVLAHGGAMSGEHGDGLIRSWLNEKMFGKELYQAFKDIKAAFDPRNLMNPGKIVDGPSLTQNLRLSPETPNAAIPTFLDFGKEGGIELAADMCNGNGLCRKMESLMCPSFQATKDEYDTTRARAQALRSIIHGKLPSKELSGDALYDVLDLCIECKGCKRECPSQVDMAKMKAEILFQHQEKHGYSLRNRLFAHQHTLNLQASRFPRISHAITSSVFGKAVLRQLGVATERELPPSAPVKFSSWFRNYSQSLNKKQIVLFSDTYTEFNEPEIGKAACKVLSALGYHISIVAGHCCGRPLISKGFLRQAKKNALKVMDTLLPFVDGGFPIIGLEPSCMSAFRDDYQSLLGNNQLLDSVVSRMLSFDEFLEHHVQEGKLPLPFIEKTQEIWIHGHCHQKALVGMAPTLEVLCSVPGFEVHEINSGCCGMAGAFGYEKEHYEISMKIGELRLFPAVREAPPEAWVVASGMSCRSQILHGTGRRALHLAEAIALHMLSP